MQTKLRILQEIRFREVLPYLLAILLFALMSIAYVSPVLEGRQLWQADIVKWQGMAQEIVEHREQSGEEALWTNSMFGGMPAYQVSVRWANNIADFLHDVITLWLPRPADMIFLYFAGFFLFLLLLRVNPWLAMAGAVAFALSSYHFIILEAGHNSKAVAIGYMAPVLGSIIYTFRGKLMGGGLLFAIFMGLQLYANHYQITYYLALIVLLYGAFELWQHITEKRLRAFGQKLAVLVAALVVAVGINIGNFWGTYVYSSETMRGGTELSIRDEPVTSGLDKEYITAWSYGIEESLSLLIPNAKGGGTSRLGDNPRALDTVDPVFREIVAQENHYWGNQPFTSGPVYVGAVVLFFFFLALFYVKGPLKWALALAVLLSLMLSWGKNFMPLTDFFIDFVPGYNKFRAVSMTLVIAELAIPALAFLGLCHLWRDPGRLSLTSKEFITASGLTAGVALLLYIAPGILTFLSEMEKEGYGELARREPAMAAQINEFLYHLEQARISIFRADALRSLLFALAAALITLLFARKRINQSVFIILLIGLITLDMWPVNRRYLNDDSFEHRRRIERPFPLRTADRYILEDTDQFRVLDITESTFNSSRTSYHHHSIGGYHGAKLQRYQDLIDFHIQDEMDVIRQSLQQSTSDREIEEALGRLRVLNMLNTRYVIYHPEAPPLVNPHAMGNAWLARDLRWVDSADEEIRLLGDTDARYTALVDRRFSSLIQEEDFTFDPGARISLVHYQPNKLRYAFNAPSPQLAVFSEVYYPEGWQVFVNGEEAGHFRVNYILRAMVLPAGEHEIEFRFRPRAYYTGRYVSAGFSALLVLGILLFAWRSLNVRPGRHDSEEEV